MIASSVTAARASLFLSSSGRWDPIFVKASRISVADCFIRIPDSVVFTDISFACSPNQERFFPSSPAKAERLSRFSSNFSASSAHFWKPIVAPVSEPIKDKMTPEYFFKPLATLLRENHLFSVVRSCWLCSCRIALRVRISLALALYCSLPRVIFAISLIVFCISARMDLMSLLISRPLM